MEEATNENGRRKESDWQETKLKKVLDIFALKFFSTFCPISIFFVQIRAPLFEAGISRKVSEHRSLVPFLLPQKHLEKSGVSFYIVR